MPVPFLKGLLPQCFQLPAVLLVVMHRLRAFPVVGVHPNDNTATVFLTPQDLERAVAAGGSPLIWLTI